MIRNHPDIRFDGRVAVVTGAGGGLGRRHALELANRGASLVVNDTGGSVHGDGRDGNRAQAVVNEILAGGGRAIADRSDISTVPGASALVDRALQEFGRLDILINNAGIIRDKTFAKMPLDDFEIVLRVHLLGTVYVTKATLPAMREGRFGRIVFTTSSVGLFGNFGQTNYAAAKMGLVGFMQALKLEAAKDGILVNAVAPLAATRMSEGIFPPEMTGELGPERVSPLVVFFCSEQCARSGDIVVAGGGLFARAAMMEGQGIVLHDPSPEDIAAHYDSISSLTDATTFGEAPEEFRAAFSRLTPKNSSAN